MKVLTDTHTLVWALSEPEALGAKSARGARRTAVHGERRQSMGTGSQSRKPGGLIADPLRWWEKYVVRARIPALVIRAPHIRALAGLPELHKDPFDRILVAQALAEGMTLATKDAILARYGAPVVWD